MKSLKVVFAGTPEFGLACLDAIAHSPHHLQAIYTQPDRPAGRGRKLRVSPVKNWGIMHGLPIYQPVNFKNENALAELAALEPDVLVVIAYGLILPSSVLSLARLACINVHASLLPRWRGASPIQQALLHGDVETGVTIMKMDAGMDTGDMLAKVSCKIADKDTAASLHDRLAQLAPKPLLAVLAACANGELSAEIQDNSKATYAAKIKKEEAAIDWQQSAIQIDRQIRAYNPWPIAYTHSVEKVLRIHQARVEDRVSPEKPGTILSLDRNGLLIATGSQALMVERLQFPGGKPMTVADWLHAGRSSLQVGLILQ